MDEFIDDTEFDHGRPTLGVAKIFAYDRYAEVVESLSAIHAYKLCACWSIYVSPHPTIVNCQLLQKLTNGTGRHEGN